MMNDKKSSGVSTLGLLQVAFIIMKVAGVISWSWWAVLIPVWFELGCIIILVIGLYNSK